MPSLRIKIIWPSLVMLFAALLPASQVLAEKARIPLAYLKESPLSFIGTVTARSEAVIRGEWGVTDSDKSFALAFMVEIVLKDAKGAGIKAGEPFMVSAWQHNNGKNSMRTGASGNHDIPHVGDRVRVFADNRVEGLSAPGVAWKVEYPNGFQPLLHLAFIGGDEECQSGVILPAIAQSMAHELPIKCAAKEVPPKNPEFSNTTYLGLMEDVDASLLFLRSRDLSTDDRFTLEQILKMGHSIVGLRDSLRAFAMTKGSHWEWLNDGFPQQVWGQKWLGQHGGASRTRVLPVDPLVKNHPILRGITGGFEVPSNLLRVDPLPADAKVLLWGEAIGSDAAPEMSRRQPILWIRENAVTDEQRDAWKKKKAAELGELDHEFHRVYLLVPEAMVPRRIAFCTLGDPGDFANVQVRRVVEQMLLWAAARADMIPADGLRCEMPAGWTPPGATAPAPASVPMSAP